MQNYAQSNVSAPAPNVASSYAGHQTIVHDQHSTSGYAVQPQQPVQPQTITATDGNATAMGVASDAASMFATPHAEDKKEMFPSSGENVATNNTADVFSSPPPADSNADETNNTADVFSSPPPAEDNTAKLSQQQATFNDAVPSEQTDLAPTQNETPPAEDASSFFGATPESTAPAPTKTFGGLPPPPVFGNNAAKPLSAPSNTGGSSSLPPPPMLKTFSNQTPNTAAPAEDEIPTEQFADVSL